MTAARLSLSKFGLACVALALACFLQIASSGSAFASGQNHVHVSESQSGAVAETAHAQRAVELVYSVDTPAAPESAAAGCVGPDHHKSDSSSKSCCGSMCCAAAVAWESGGSEAPGERAGSAWLFTQQLVFANAVFGLDRPPDFSV